jgi:hypothetical protein
MIRVATTIIGIKRIDREGLLKLRSSESFRTTVPRSRGKAIARPIFSMTRGKGPA